MNRFYCYSRCGTCKKAIKYLKENNIQYDYYEIVDNHLTKEDLKQIHEQSGKPIKKLFNTSGNVYRELNLKDKLSDMTNDEAYELLASNGMLIKRPLLITDNDVLIGFKEEEYKEALL